jgi:hypothetical protein
MSRCVHRLSLDWVLAGMLTVESHELGHLIYKLEKVPFCIILRRL